MSCMNNLKNVDTSGALLAVRDATSDYVIGRAFTQSAAAKMLDRQPQVIYRWQQRGIFPPPTLVDDKGNTFYADDEVTLPARSVSLDALTMRPGRFA